MLLIIPDLNINTQINSIHSTVQNNAIYQTSVFTNKNINVNIEHDITISFIPSVFTEIRDWYLRCNKTFGISSSYKVSDIYLFLDNTKSYHLYNSILRSFSIPICEDENNYGDIELTITSDYYDNHVDMHEVQLLLRRQKIERILNNIRNEN